MFCKCCRALLSFGLWIKKNMECWLFSRTSISIYVLHDNMLGSGSGQQKIHFDQRSESSLVPALFCFLSVLLSHLFHQLDLTLYPHWPGITDICGERDKPLNNLQSSWTVLSHSRVTSSCRYAPTTEAFIAYSSWQHLVMLDLDHCQT